MQSEPAPTGCFTQEVGCWCGRLVLAVTALPHWQIARDIWLHDTNTLRVGDPATAATCAELQSNLKSSCRLVDIRPAMLVQQAGRSNQLPYGSVAACSTNRYRPQSFAVRLV
jgi:hypothetical protein